MDERVEPEVQFHIKGIEKYRKYRILFSKLQQRVWDLLL